jgi:prefoldin subunit 5
MFRAIARFFRALGHLFTGKVDSATSTIATKPEAVRATFNEILREKKRRIQQYMEAVSAMIAQEEKKKAELQRLSEEVVRLKKLRDGAAAMARKIVERHHGNVEAVKSDPEYAKCQAAFKDFSSTIEEKEARCAALEEDIKTLQQSIAGHKNQLLALQRELEKIKQEQSETVADLITAQEEKQLSDMLAGISDDRTSQELQEMRDLRSRARAAARVSREMAGADTAQAEAEFMEYATQTASDNEFDRLIGLTREEAPKPQEEKKEEPAERPRLPEA